MITIKKFWNSRIIPTTTFGSHLDVEKDKLDHRKMPSVIEKDNLELSFYI